jgi:hypothetical protein
MARISDKFAIQAGEIGGPAEIPWAFSVSRVDEFLIHHTTYCRRRNQEENDAASGTP